MPVAVQHNPREFSSAQVQARLAAVGGGKPTESSRHAPGNLLAEDRRGEFLAMILHELRNPLGNILAGVAFLRDSEGMEPRSDWLWTGLEKSTRKVENLLTDLMDLCGATHPTFQLRRRPMDLAAAARTAVERHRCDYERAGLGLEFQSEVGPLQVSADPERLELILTNLIDNAAKYTEPGGRVTVAVEASAGEVVLRVRDTGIGIAPEVLPFVFDPFVREKAAGSRPRQGSGIGLLLVRTLVELHGGRVEAFSAGRGRGSEFVVRLPALETESSWCH
jgi:signal transduction histidine kinase